MATNNTIFREIKQTMKSTLSVFLFLVFLLGITNDSSAQKVDGKKVYTTKCLSCHQASGLGITGAFPPLDESDWVIGDKGRLIRIILNGVTGELEVNGLTYGGAMPPWNTFINDEEMAALLNHIRNSWSNEGEEITADEVARVRASVKDRKQPWTQAELKKLSAFGVPK